MNSTAADIIAYLSDELPEQQQQRFEEQLFSGALDGSDLDELAELTVALREADFLGILAINVQRSQMERIRAHGYRVICGS